MAGCRYLLTAIIVLFVSNSAESADETLEDLVSRWTVQQDEITSADIEFRVFNRSVASTITEQEIRSKFFNGGSDLSAEELNSLVREIARSLPANLPVFSHGRILVGRGAVKTETSYSDSKTTQLRDQNGSLVSGGASGQVNIFRPGESPVYQIDLSALRYIPNLNESEKFSVQSPGEPGSTFVKLFHTSVEKGVKAEGTMLVDFVSGLVFEHRLGVTMSGQETAFKSVKVIWQKGPLVNGSSVTFPSQKLTCQFFNNQLASAELFVIDKTSFNSLVSEDRLLVPAATGSVIVDHRKSRNSPFVFKLKSDTPNVISATE